MIQKIIAHTLILLFVSIFSFESVEFFMGEDFEHHENLSGILELEEESGNTEESKEEKDELIKYDDTFYSEDLNFKLYSISQKHIIILNSHYEASDYSANIFSPPDFI